MADNTARTTHKILIIVLLAAGVFTRVYHLGDKILWSDEGFVYHAATRASLHELHDIYRLEQHTAQHNIVTFYWIRAFGDSIVSLHAQSVVWSVLTLFLFGALVWKMFPPYAALGALGALALNPLLAEYAQVLRYPALAGLHAMLCFGSLLMLRRTGRRIWLPAYAAALLLFVFVHLYSLFTIACLGAFVLFTRREWGRNYIPLVLAHTLPLAAIIPKLMLMRETGISELAGSIPLASVLKHLAAIPVGGILDIAFQFSAGRSTDMRAMPLAALGALFVALGITACTALAHKRCRFEAWMAFSVLAGAVLLGWLSMIFQSVHFRPYYYIPLIPLFCMLLGLGADTLRRRRPWAAHALLAALTIFFLAFLLRYWTRLDRPPNYKSVLQYIEANAQKGDFLAISPPYYVYIDYYWSGKMPASRFHGDFDLWNAPQNSLVVLNRDAIQITETDMLQWHRAMAANHERVWMLWVLGAKNTEDQSATAFHWMESHYERLYATRIRNLPQADEYTGLLVLYRIRPLIGENSNP